MGASRSRDWLSFAATKRRCRTRASRVTALGVACQVAFPYKVLQLGSAVAGGMARGNVDSGPYRRAGRIRRNAPPDSGWPEHPDTDYHLPQVWDDRACGGTACQRTSLDPGFGPVRNRVEGSNPRPGERMGSIPRATPAGRRRKSFGRGPAKLLALKIAAGAPRPKTCGSEFCVAACVLIIHVVHNDVSRVATKYSRPSKGGNRHRGWH
jgi:hypothetical protein